MKKGIGKTIKYVIGYDEEEGDPFFVDITKVDFPVFTAEHGRGDWEPKLLFDSLDQFLSKLKTHE